MERHAGLELSRSDLRESEVSQSELRGSGVGQSELRQSGVSQSELRQSNKEDAAAGAGETGEWRRVYRGTSLIRKRNPPRTTAGP